MRPLSHWSGHAMAASTGCTSVKWFMFTISRSDCTERQVDLELRWSHVAQEVISNVRPQCITVGNGFLNFS